jgi:hypothetical protein
LAILQDSSGTQHPTGRRSEDPTKGSQSVALTKRLTVASLAALAISLFSAGAAKATTLPTWSWAQCAASGPTWNGYPGINNDNPVPATVTALSVTNGVQVQGMAVGTQLGSFGTAGNLEGAATGISTSVASFTVTITLSWKDAAGATVTGTRAIVVTQPATCTADVGVPTTTTTPSTTAAPTPTTPPATPASSPASTPAPPAAPGATTVPGATTAPTVLVGPPVTQAPPATRAPIPLQPTVLGSTVTLAPGAVTSLPVTGSHSSGRVLVLAALVTALGITLVTTSTMGRPTPQRAVTKR